MLTIYVRFCVLSIGFSPLWQEAESPTSEARRDQSSSVRGAVSSRGSGRIPLARLGGPTATWWIDCPSWYVGLFASYRGGLPEIYGTPCGGATDVPPHLSENQRSFVEPSLTFRVSTQGPAFMSAFSIIISFPLTWNFLHTPMFFCFLIKLMFVGSPYHCNLFFCKNVAYM